MAKKAYLGVGGIARKVKNGYVGVNSVKYTLRNIAPTINGKTGFNAGSASTTHTKYASSSLMLTGTTSAVEVTAMSNATYPLVKGHKYYARVEIYQESVVGSSDFYWPVAEPSFYNGKVATAGKWKIIGTVSTRSSWDSGSYNLRLDFNNNNNAGYMWFDGLMLIDLTEAFGEGNEPTATWMKKNVPFFTGTLDIEKKTTEGIARPIKKAYIGIGGVARPCWPGEELVYYGTITPLSHQRAYFGAGSVGNYALFAGGRYTPDPNEMSKPLTSVEAYNESLTRTTITPLSNAANVSSATVGNYVLFIYGQSGDAYNTSLTKTTVTKPGTQNNYYHGTTVGNYALFAGGYPSSTHVVAYSSSLTKKTPTALSEERQIPGASSIGGYALIAGGSSDVSSVDTYNASLTRGSAPNLSDSKTAMGATSVGNYAIFAAGYDGRTSVVKSVDAYNYSLTKTVCAPFTTDSCDAPCGVTLGKYALFAGGYADFRYHYVSTNEVTVYDELLTKLNTDPMSEAGKKYGTTVGKYALFCGKFRDDDSTIVDAYTID